VITASRIVVVSSVKKKKPSPSRTDKAAATRARMLDAAYAQFCELGFRATTMDAIAERAGVAVQTLYFTFHTKDELLQAVHDRTVLGDDAVPPPHQQWYLDAMAEPDGAKALHRFVTGISTILARAAPMQPVYDAVAHDPAGAVHLQAEQLRLAGYADLLTHLEAKTSLRHGLDRPHAIDALFVLIGPAIYRSLVIERGWTPTEWIDWTTTILNQELFSRPRLE
jgi:AcrR family transcriptional regulator